jgi:hypothetical protein
MTPTGYAMSTQTEINRVQYSYTVHAETILQMNLRELKGDFSRKPRGAI